MQQIQITAPQDIRADLHLPASKSICNRALIINALAHCDGLIHNLSDCDDTLVMIDALRHMPPVIDIKAAGTAMRFLTSFLSVTPGSHTITGTERMQNRPIQILVDALRQLGADISYTNREGYPPLQINGKPLQGGILHLPGHVSSQYISSLLMVGPVLRNGLTLVLQGDIVSRPYINMTLQLMRQYGAEADWTSPDTIAVSARPYTVTDYTVENDWSAASYWYEMAALSSHAEISLPGLFKQSLQGDSQVAVLFAQLGVSTVFADGKVLLKQTGHCVDRMEYDFVAQPDLAQTFVVTCALLDVPFRFTGLQSLKIKETDRIAALIAEMRKLGYVLTEHDGSQLEWTGQKVEADCPPIIDTYEDHRMAMAFAPASLRVQALRINHPQVVTKSYPAYWDHLRSAGFRIEEV